MGAQEPQRSSLSEAPRACEQAGPMARLGCYGHLWLAPALLALAQPDEAASLQPIVEFNGPGVPCGPGTMVPHIHDHGVGNCPLPGGWTPCTTGGFGELCAPPGIHVELFVFAHTTGSELCETSATLCKEMVSGSGHWFCDLRGYCSRYGDYDLVFNFLNDTDTLCYQPQALDVCGGECGFGTFGWSGCNTPAIGMLGYIVLLLIGMLLCCLGGTAYYYVRKYNHLIPVSASSLTLQEQSEDARE
eukprot:NODE_16569_length_987_cov_8.298837.p1 GENE.NODE_16569_length_987_cov_8.298837~~NODE_16569_length_987_cov_8.298837.p1  ORF type:complete len:245 (+),score=69.07 NODE_16569_length_987_cov_8.298837:55-789(+)